jgi:ankyrin repeat protein
MTALEAAKFDDDFGELLLAYSEKHRDELPDPSEWDAEKFQASQERFDAWREERWKKEAAAKKARDGERDHFLRRARVGDLSDVKAALDKNPSLVYEKKPQTEETALHLAARHGHVEVVRLLLERSADPGVQAIERYSPRTAALWAIGNPHRGTTDEKQQQIADMIYKAGGR